MWTIEFPSPFDGQISFSIFIFKIFTTKIWSLIWIRVSTRTSTSPPWSQSSDDHSLIPKNVTIEV
jgi:hypothetical protein